MHGTDLAYGATRQPSLFPQNRSDQRRYWPAPRGYLLGPRVGPREGLTELRRTHSTFTRLRREKSTCRSRLTPQSHLSHAQHHSLLLRLQCRRGLWSRAVGQTRPEPLDGAHRAHALDVGLCAYGGERLHVADRRLGPAEEHHEGGRASVWIPGAGGEGG
eukprot:2506609-Rhodomonas_salina.1